MNIASPAPSELSPSNLGRLVTSPLGLALLIFPEGILLGRGMASRHDLEINLDRELVAMGMANLGAGLIRSFAVGGSHRARRYTSEQPALGLGAAPGAFLPSRR